MLKTLPSRYTSYVRGKNCIIYWVFYVFLLQALAKLGLIDEITYLVSSMIQSVDESARLPFAIIIIQWVSALASSFIDNIPFTTAMVGSKFPKTVRN